MGVVKRRRAPNVIYFLPRNVLPEQVAKLQGTCPCAVPWHGRVPRTQHAIRTPGPLVGRILWEIDVF